MPEKSAGKKPKKKLAGNRTTSYICIVCPNCCELETDGTEVTGARCEKGETFARQEAVLPLRVITTTVRCDTEKGTRTLPVKTAVPVPLASFPDIMKEIKKLRLRVIPGIGSRITTKDPAKPVELIVTGE